MSALAVEPGRPVGRRESISFTGNRGDSELVLAGALRLLRA